MGKDHRHQPQWSECCKHVAILAISGNVSTQHPMRLFGKLIGLVLILAGIYFLGQNIIFTTQVSTYWWRDLSASGSVISILAGLLMLLYGDRGLREIGWILVGLGIALVFISGKVILRPTSLWTFFLAFAALLGGFQIITTGRLRL